MHIAFILISCCLLKLYPVTGLTVTNHVDTGKFWHISDIHVDSNYSRYGNLADLCHQTDFIHPDNGLYGNFLCDSPEYLVNITFRNMKNIQDKPDFIIWTGDNLPHTNTFDPEWDVIYETLNNISLKFKSFFPGIPVYPSIGNHDTFPPNMLIPSNDTSSIYTDILNKGGWKDFLKENSIATFKKGGYYSQTLRKDLRIISLNTVLWYYPNNYTENLEDPTDQFKWLNEVLDECLKSSENAFIIGHVPPGFYNRVKRGEKSNPTFHLHHLNAYLQIVKKFSSIITCQLFGHLHMDMFQLFQSDTGTFISSSLLASSVTPWYSLSPDNVSVPVNPSIRLMYYNRSNGDLLDFEQFYLNLTKANNARNDQVHEGGLYELLYKFTNVYNVPNLSTQSLVTVFENLKQSDTLFEKFYHFSSAGKISFDCDSFCKVAQLCSISSTSQIEYDDCMRHSDVSDFTCHMNEFMHENYLKYFIYVSICFFSILGVASIILVFHRCRRTQNEVYTKLLGSF